jgi:hypothetical protein
VDELHDRRARTDLRRRPWNTNPPPPGVPPVTRHGHGRLHHLAWFVDTREELLRAADLFLDADVPIEAAPSKHAVAQGMFLLSTSPAATPSR